jgi:hypothetical protein
MLDCQVSLDNIVSGSLRFHLSEKEPEQQTGDTMKIDSALDLVNALIYKPGWRISATDHSNRFEGAIQVRIDYPAHASEREHAPEYEKEINTHATFPLIVEDCDNIALYRQVYEKIMEIDSHEIREFLRVQPTMWAPFHPHRVGGMKLAEKLGISTVQADLQFGIA